MVNMSSLGPGFHTCERKGFHVTFENGWTVSVQFGYGNYCDNYDWKGNDPSDPMSRFKDAAPHSRTAEVAAWPADGDMIDLGDGDTVGGRYSPAMVLALMNDIAARPSTR